MNVSLPKVEQSGNVRILTFTSGVIRDLEDVIGGELGGRTDGLEGGHLLLDFTNVNYITSVELGSLIWLHKKMSLSEGRLTLFNLSAHVYEVFKVTRLNTLFAICRAQRSVQRGGIQE